MIYSQHDWQGKNFQLEYNNMNLITLIRLFSGLIYSESENTHQLTGSG